MSKICAFPGKCYELSGDLTANANTPIFIDGEADLLSALSPDKHTYFVINDGVNCEYVRVGINASGTGLTLTDRGMDSTKACAFSKGAKVSFEWFIAALDDYMDCRAEVLNDEMNPPIKIPNHTAEFDPDTGQWCYIPDDPVAAGGVSWTVGKETFTFKDGTITSEPANTPGLQPGVYANATVTVDNNCQITKVEQGNKPLYTPSVSDKCCPNCGTTNNDPV